MAIVLYPHVREWAKYVPDWRHLDPGQRPMGASMRVQLGKFREPVEYDGHTRQPAMLTFSRPVTLDEAIQATYDQFAKGCSCEHDCCGCWHGGMWDLRATTRRGKRGTAGRPSRYWRGYLGYARNY
jgi:hypothetical protein